MNCRFSGPTDHLIFAVLRRAGDDAAAGARESERASERERMEKAKSSASDAAVVKAVTAARSGGR